VLPGPKAPEASGERARPGDAAAGDVIRYEQLRQQVLDGEAGGWRLGLGVLQHRWVAARHRPVHIKRRHRLRDPAVCGRTRRECWCTCAPGWVGGKLPAPYRSLIGGGMVMRLQRRSSRANLVRTLLACGVAYSLLYVVENDVIAATRYEGYSRMSQAISELSAKGAPTRRFLAAMLPLSGALMTGLDRPEHPRVPCRPLKTGKASAGRRCQRGWCECGASASASLFADRAGPEAWQAGASNPGRMGRPAGKGNEASRFAGGELR
jgi:hypothetical protein